MVWDNISLHTIQTYFFYIIVFGIVHFVHSFQSYDRSKRTKRINDWKSNRFMSQECKLSTENKHRAKQIVHLRIEYLHFSLTQRGCISPPFSPLCVPATILESINVTSFDSIFKRRFLSVSLERKIDRISFSLENKVN